MQVLDHLGPQVVLVVPDLLVVLDQQVPQVVLVVLDQQVPQVVLVVLDLLVHLVEMVDLIFTHKDQHQQHGQ